MTFFVDLEKGDYNLISQIQRILDQHILVAKWVGKMFRRNFFHLVEKF